MLPLNDPLWHELTGGYKVPFNPSKALLCLEAGENNWDELWNELHHQGDVGTASYAAVPHLVRIAKSISRRDWNFYGLVSTIEVERHRKSNPLIPAWLVPAYKSAMLGLMELAIEDLAGCADSETLKSILGAIALAKGNIELGALISNSDESEVMELLDQYDAWSDLYSVRPL